MYHRKPNSLHGRLGVRNVENHWDAGSLQVDFSVDWSVTHLLDWSGEGRGGRGSTEKSSSLPCTASMLVLARVKGAVGRAMPIRTGTIRDSATLQSSSTAYGNRAWKTRLHFPMGCGMKLLKEKQKRENVRMSNVIILPLRRKVNIYSYLCNAWHMK